MIYFCVFVFWNIKMCASIDKKASFWGPLPGHCPEPHWRSGSTGMYVALGPNNL